MLFPGGELLLVLFGAVIAMCCALAASAAIALPARGRGIVQVIGCILPIAVAAAALLHYGGIVPAVTLLTSSAATIAIFVTGAIVLITPRPHGEPPAAQSPTASLVLPMALVLMLAGFSAHLTLATCIGLAVLGVLSVDLGRDLTATAPVEPSRAAAPTWILAAVTAAVALGVLYAITGRFWESAQASKLIRIRELAVVNLLCPALLLPLLRSTLRTAHDGSPSDALGSAGTCIGVLLGLLLPTAYGVDFLLRRHADETAMLAGLPQLSWRLDAPMLAAGGFALVAMRLDVVRPHRWVGLLLVLLYGAYLLAGSALRLF